LPVRKSGLPRFIVNQESGTGHRWRSLQRAGLALLFVTALVACVDGLAGAAAPTEGSIVPDAAAPIGSVTPGPFSSGQGIDVVVPANAIFSPTANILIVECSAPNGVPPILPSACNGDTVNGNSVEPNADGSIDYQAETTSPYQVFATPDSAIGDQSSSPACGETATTECILFIGNNQNDFTQPHVWSQPFFITASASDDGSNPGDGTAPTTPTAPSPTVSTVTAAPATATADGKDSSIVTVTLKGTSGVPVSGKTVTLDQGAGNSTVVPGQSPNATDSNGQVTFTVTDTTPETVTYSATDTTDSVPLATKPTVDFEAPAVDAQNGQVTASLATVPTGGSTTITVTLLDQAANPQPVSGETVQLKGTGTTVAISPATAGSDVTNAQGVAEFTATDSATEQVTFAATDTTSNVVLASTPVVTFGTLSASASASTVTAQSPAPVGNLGAGVSVALLTSNGTPVAGKTIALTGTGSTVTIAPETAGSDVTNAKGVATFIVADDVAEKVTLTATDTTDTPSIPITQTPVVSFGTSVPSATTSTVVAQSPTSVADGQTDTQIVVTMNDQFGDPVPAGTAVSLTVTGSAEEHPIAIGSTDPGKTTASGTTEFEVNDTAAEVVTITATDTSDTPTVQVTQTATIAYIAGAADPQARTSMVAASNSTPPSDGTTATTLTVTLTDEFGNPIAGKTVSVAALNGSAVLVTVNPLTDASGLATFTATDATAEVVTFQATDSTDGDQTMTGLAVVTFGNPPVPPPVSAFSSVVATPTSVPADGASNSTISILLYNGDGNAVPGKTVTLTASGGASTMTAVNPTSDNTGAAEFTVSDDTAETVTYTAHDSTDSVDLTGQSVAVTFTTASGKTGTTTTTTTTAPGGSTTTTTAPGGATTTTAIGGPTTTTTDPSGILTSSSSSDGSSGSSGSGSSLAFTGVSTSIPWLAGIGALFLGLGTLGRRRFRVAK
jgi:Bacterial Ig-like domain (group 1)